MLETGSWLTVNGVERSVACEPDTPLLDVLRHDLGLAGPRFGCGLGLCGACYVLIGDRARSSCDLSMSAVDASVVTVEGLSAGDRLHPVQQAFIDEQAAQCGYCTCGMVMAAVGLLRERSAPAEREVREALDGNLCRCGAHGRIVHAALKAAGQRSDGRTATRSSDSRRSRRSRCALSTRPAKPRKARARSPRDRSPAPSATRSPTPSGTRPRPAALPVTASPGAIDKS